MNAVPIEIFLAQLTKVRQRQSGQWSACCPAHADKSPSLSVRETPNGAVLVHCFAGCSVSAVMAALGLNMAHLYPPRQLTGKEPKRTPRLLTAMQALELLDCEAHFLVVAAANLKHGVKLSESDLARITLAARRIHFLLEECSPLGGAHA